MCTQIINDLLEMRALLTRSLSLVEQALAVRPETTPAHSDNVQNVKGFVFDPSWKSAASGGRQFTQKGIDAIYAMLEARLSNKDISQLTGASLNAIPKFRKMYESGNWGRIKPTQLKQ